MNKTSLLILVATVLLVLNLIMLFVFFSPKKSRQSPRGVIIKQLNFDDRQIEKYDVLINQHQASIKLQADSIKVNKKQLYNQLAKSNQQNKDAIINNINKFQKNIEQIHFKHFEDIKALCREDQLEDYNSLTKQLARLFAPPPPPKK